MRRFDPRRLKNVREIRRAGGVRIGWFAASAVIAVFDIAVP